ncbi:MAG: hypothetical protein EA417_05400 [Gammaproteobacteria bacterium]|nr:MAG: hypothetical protein EA417_05400 [Gammaproteobacteria bacterium]
MEFMPPCGAEALVPDTPHAPQPLLGAHGPQPRGAQGPQPRGAQGPQPRFGAHGPHPRIGPQGPQPPVTGAHGGSKSCCNETV